MINQKCKKTHTQGRTNQYSGHRKKRLNLQSTLTTTSGLTNALWTSYTQATKTMRRRKSGPTETKPVSSTLTDSWVLFYEEAVLGESLHVEDKIARKLRHAEAFPAGLDVFRHRLPVVLLDDLKERHLDGRQHATWHQGVLTSAAATSIFCYSLECRTRGRERFPHARDDASLATVPLKTGHSGRTFDDEK